MTLWRRDRYCYKVEIKEGIDRPPEQKKKKKKNGRGREMAVSGGLTVGPTTILHRGDVLSPVHSTPENFENGAFFFG